MIHQRMSRGTNGIFSCHPGVWCLASSEMWGRLCTGWSTGQEAPVYIYIYVYIYLLIYLYSCYFFNLFLYLWIGVSINWGFTPKSSILRGFSNHEPSIFNFWDAPLHSSFFGMVCKTPVFVEQVRYFNDIFWGRFMKEKGHWYTSRYFCMYILVIMGIKPTP